MILHNENKLDEMSQILDDLHKYAPTCTCEGELTLSNHATLTFEDTTFFETLIGSDELTVARVCRAKNLRSNHDTVQERLEGLTGVIEDWHARVIVLEVSV